MSFIRHLFKLIILKSFKWKIQSEIIHKQNLIIKNEFTTYRRFLKFIEKVIKKEWNRVYF